LLGQVERLRDEDPEFWPHVWAPLAAVAAQATGGDGGDLLAEAVECGFRQPDLLPEVQETFEKDPRWAELRRAMTEPAPPPQFEVTEWPQVTYGPALVLDRLAPDREVQLRELLPSRRAGAWETAKVLLEWTAGAWQHANDHVEREDALEVLERVAIGERFACVEYSIVLSQALNAVGIPARRLSLRMRDQHVGFGRGHVVSEAWIDDFGRWVVLDGQNGAWWGAPDQPLGVRELQRLLRTGAERPPMVSPAREVTAAEHASRWRYFDSAATSGLGWADTLVPTFQGRPSSLRLAVTSKALTHPDLAQLETGTVETADSPALEFRPAHPFAVGVSLDGTHLELDTTYELGHLKAGNHALEVRTRTAYGELAPQPLCITVRN
jgi:hypothetical protein